MARSGREHYSFAAGRGGEQRTVCRACGANLEVRVHFSGKIVWIVDPENPDFGSDQPDLRGDVRKVQVVCSADVMHPCGYAVVNGVLVEAGER